MAQDINKSIDSFVEKSFDDLKADLKQLVDIKSVESEAIGDAPYGLGVQRALYKALDLARSIGMEAVDCEGRIGYAHLGNDDKFIGVIGHVDVVPEGEGWNTDPYSLTECGGYLLGRGTLDDKSGYIIGLYTAKFLIENEIPLKYGLRLLVGCDEEVGMSDIEYYKAHCKVPAVTLVPDTEFPVCHGEKGIYSADLVSATPVSAAVKELKGGIASNVVPEKAHIVIDAPLDKVRKAAEKYDFLTVTGSDGAADITAHGVSAHAGDPDGGTSAILLLASFVAKSGLVPEGDAEKFAQLADILSVNDGSKLGIAADDGIFTPLTCIGGMISLDEGRKITENLNIRYPTNTSDKEISAKIAFEAHRRSFELCNEHGGNGPHYIPADSGVITTLLNVYNAETGEQAKPYVMSGGTYARYIPNAAAFGPHFISEKRPDFVGDVHCKNEGISIEHLKLALKIYIKSVIALQSIEL